MQPVNGPVVPPSGERPVTSSALTTSSTSSTSVPSSSATSNLPLTLTQRTTLDTLIVKLEALTSLSSNTIWTTLRQDIGVSANQTLLSQHFQPAEQALQTRVTQAQQNPLRMPLLQRLTELLPYANNRQLVSQIIRQEFGHTELNALSQPQLQRVLTLLQNTLGAAITPQTTPAGGGAGAVANGTLSATAALLERPLSPAEQRGLNQWVTRLSNLTGEQSGKIWSALMTMQNLTAGTPVPAKHLPLLTQFLQTQTDLHQYLNSGRNTPPTSSPGAGTPAVPGPQSTPTATLSALASVIHPAPDVSERQWLQEFTQERFQLAVQAPLTAMQLNEVVTFLFTHRLQRSQETQWAAVTVFPQPIVSPLMAALPPAWQAVFSRPMFWTIVSVCLVIFLLWVLI